MQPLFSASTQPYLLNKGVLRTGSSQYYGRLIWGDYLPEELLSRTLKGSFFATSNYWLTQQIYYSTKQL